MSEFASPDRLSPAERVVGHGPEEQFQKVWTPPPGLGRLIEVNNGIVGARFIFTGFIFFLIGGVLAILMRTQLIVPDNDLLSSQTFNQFFTMHGTTMMFLFAVPILEAFAIYILPGMLGTRDLCFPRLTAFGFWCYLFGGLLLYSSFLVGMAPDTGWFMYVPLTQREFSPGLNADFWLLGITFIEVATISGAVEIIATILKGRAPGMTLNRMPIFAWVMLVVSFMIVFAFPALVLASVMLEVERVFDIPFFDVARGGDSLLWQHLFWIFGHPEVYIIFLPAAGLVSAMLPAFARTKLVGYTWIVLAVVATGFLSFGLWAHHMYATGIPDMALAFFAGASMAVAIPSAIQVFAWIATLWHGRPVLRTPLLFILGAIVIFVVGGLTGVMVAVVPFDWQVHDTYFVVAHFHYVLIGGMVFPLFAALTYYMPRETGRMMNEKLGQLSFWLMFIGFNVAFLPMHWTGMIGMPRRVFTYPAGSGWEMLNLISTLGSYMIAAGVLVFIINVVWHLRLGFRAGVNPWQSEGLEWATETPSHPYNHRSIPRVKSVAPLWDQPDIVSRIRHGEEYLPTALEGRREALVTSVVSAKPEYVLRLSHPTVVPLLAAIATGVMFIGVLVSVYTATLIGAVVLLGIMLIWFWRPLPEKEEKDVGLGLHLPISLENERSVGWIGAIVFLLVDAAFFAALVYSYFYLWSVATIWPPSGFAPDLTLPAVIGAILLLPCTIAAAALQGMANRGAPTWTWFAIAAGALSFAALAGATYFAYLDLPFTARSHAYAGVVLGLGLSVFVHAIFVAGAALYAAAEMIAGHLSWRRNLSLRVAALFGFYTAGQGAIVFAIVYLAPLGGG
jgi:cytochrome c oxidase subunit I+III